MPPPNDVMEFRVNALETTVAEVANAVKSIDASLKVLAMLEVKHAETREALERCFTEVKELKEDHEDRIRAIEQEMPTMKLIRNWVVAGALGVITAAGMLVWDRVTQEQEPIYLDRPNG